MPLMQIFGALIILTALVATAWWVPVRGRKAAPAITVCLIAVFAGAFLILQDRVIELTIEKVGTIKAAADKAVADANAISELRDRIVAQSSTVDLVAQKATEAAKLAADVAAQMRYVQEIARIDELRTQAIAGERSQAALDELEGYSSDDSRLIDRAKTATRQVYDNYVYTNRIGKGLPDLRLVDGQITNPIIEATQEPQPLETLIVLLSGEMTLHSPVKVLDHSGQVISDGVDTVRWFGEIRTRAAHDLRFHHCAQVPEYLVRAITEDPNLWVKRQAAESLAILTAGDFNPPKVFPVAEASEWWESKGRAYVSQMPPCDMKATTNECNPQCRRHLAETRGVRALRQ